MSDVIPYGKQSITEADIQEVISVLKSDYLTQGPKVAEFEKAFANYVGAEYAVAVANGTAALHLNVLALGLKEGDQVITTPITFAASANCIRYCGGEVVFSDIDPDTYLLDIEGVRSRLEADKDRRIKGIIPVDFAGRSVDLKAFRRLADEFGCWIIEDACHAPGASFTTNAGLPSKSGSGEFADLAIFSFHPVKHIATGEGGMITTNDEKLYKKLLELRTHGITRDFTKFENTVEMAIGDPESSGTDVLGYPSWYMEMQDLGYNYRMSDINCALGISQLKRADQGITRRREIAKRYFEAFQNLDQVIDKNFEAIDDECGHAYHLYVIEVENRLGLYNWLRENKIFCQIHYIPTHLMPYYQGLGWKKGGLPKAERYYSKCISLPMYPTLEPDQQEFVIDKVFEFYNS